jgi:hypothetical protein
MSIEASSSRHAPLRPLPNQLSWTQKSFVDSDQAEAALCADRAAFVQNHTVMRMIPRKISKHIEHHDAVAQIRGFQELFIYLNKKFCSKSLRGRIRTHFLDSPYLCGHISESYIFAIMHIPF